MKNLVFILLTVISFYPSFSQTNVRKDEPACEPKLDGCSSCCDNNYIIYDFKCKTFYQLGENNKYERILNLKNLKIKYNREFKFKIININRYIYDVNLSYDDVDFGSEPSPLFNQLFLGSGLTDIKGVVPDAEIKSDSMKGLPDFNKKGLNIQKFTILYIMFKKEYDAMIDGQLNAFSYCPAFDCKCSEKSLSAIGNILLELRTQYKDDSLKIANAISESEKKVKEQTEKISTCKENQKKIKTLTEELRKLRANPRASRAAITAKSDAIKELECDLELLNDQLELMEVAAIDQEALRQKLNQLYGPTRSIVQDDLKALILFYKNMHKDHLMYTSPPIYPQGNRLKLGFGISPRASTDSTEPKSYMPLYHDSIGLDLPVRFKPFISFSTGLFGSSAERFRSDSYDWQPQPDNGVVGDSSQYKLVSTGKGARPIGFAAFANLGMKITGGFGAAISVGVGLTVEEKPRTAYLGGVSLLFGDKNQFNLTTGVMAMKVNSLKTSLYPDSDTLYNATSEIEYLSTLKVGGFVSLTYSAFKLENGRKGNSKSKR